MTQCSEKVFRDWHNYPCGSNATVERDGKWYCGRHDPVAVKARQEKAHAKYEAKERVNHCQGECCHYIFQTIGYERIFRFCPFCGTKRPTTKED